MPLRLPHILTALLVATFTIPSYAQQTVPGETDAERDIRMQWWRDAKYGMFIHWGASTYLGGEWNGKIYGDSHGLIRDAKIPPEEYAAALQPFNPIEFDAEQWVRDAQRFGFKYIVFIAKHHDGFAMWDSQASDFNIIDATEFDRDILAELSAACQKYGMKFGVYYSHARDWYHPGGAMGLRDMPNWHPSQEGEFADYIHDVAVPQVRELMTNYGPIAELWWDTPDKMTPELAAEFTELLKLQPGIVTNSRLLNRDGTGGDFDTPERYIPANQEHGLDFEVCMTIGRTWMWSKEDEREKSAQDILDNLLNIASKGGNYLLNIGPTPQGTFAHWQVERLEYVGDWLADYGEAIYGTSKGPFRYWENGYATTKGNSLYLLVTDWPTDGKLYVPIANVPTSARALGTPSQPFTFKSTDKGLFIDVPRQPLDERASVIVLDMPQPAIPIRQGQLADERGAYELTAVDGERYGLRLRLIGDVIPSWPTGLYSVTWPIYIEQPGTYRVLATYACDPDKAGGTLDLTFNQQKLTAITQPTASTTDFQTVDLGTVTFDHEQSVEVVLKQLKRKDPKAVSFKSLTIIPD